LPEFIYRADKNFFLEKQGSHDFPRIQLFKVIYRQLHKLHEDFCMTIMFFELLAFLLNIHNVS